MVTGESGLSERERRVRKALRREKKERWAHIRNLMLKGGEATWWDFWETHWPPDKWDMKYIFGRDSDHLRRHVRIELHYLQQPDEHQMELDGMFAGDGMSR